MRNDPLDTLYEVRVTGEGPVHVELDLSRSEALNRQLVLLDRFIANGDALAGWKVSYTSGRSRDRMGAGYRPFGFILRSRVFLSGMTVALPGTCRYALEPELCLVLGTPLAGVFDRDEARAAVAAVAPAFEIIQVRLPENASDAARLVDAAGQWGLVVGAPNAAAVSIDDLTYTTVRVYENGSEVACSRPGPAMDDPFASLARLCARLAEHGRSLRAGDHVITGSFTRVAIDGASRWHAWFSDVGDVAVDVAPERRCFPG